MGKVLLSSDVSTSDKLALVSDQAALLWTWLLAHANSWGQMDGSPGTVRARVAPRRNWSDEDVLGFMGELSAAGLIILYAPGVSGNFPELPDNRNIPAKLLLVTNWEKYQRLDRRAAKPEFPMPCDSLPETPGISGKLPPKGIERNRTELNLTSSTTGGANPPRPGGRVPRPLQLKIPKPSPATSPAAKLEFAHTDICIRYYEQKFLADKGHRPAVPVWAKGKARETIRRLGEGDFRRGMVRWLMAADYFFDKNANGYEIFRGLTMRTLGSFISRAESIRGMDTFAASEPEAEEHFVRAEVLNARGEENNGNAGRFPLSAGAGADQARPHGG